MEVEKTHNKTCRNGVWTKQSEEALEKAEKNILSYLKTSYKLYYVPIQTPRAKDKIWTLSMNEDSTHIPLVLIHGMAAGLALWCPNLDELAASRPVYAIDLLGFGRSSRPKFPTDPEKVVAQWVASLEEWRVAVGLNQFILLGHSLGGYISTAYAISYPERVRHLILADPWGFQEIPKDMEEEKNKLPLWRRAVASLLLSFNPLWPIRAAGPAGEWLVRTVRADVPKKFANYLPDAKKVIPEYIYQCNVQRPSGESGFQALVTGLAWPKNPMIRHVHNLHPALPVTMLYGSESWIPNVGELVREKRDPKAKTYVEMVIGASHHIYIDRPEVFDGFVLDACSMADQHDPRPDMILYKHVPEPVYVEPQAVIVSA